MTKKLLAVSVAICVMFAASSAIAQPRKPQQQPQPRMQMQPQQPMQPRMPQRECNCPQGWQGWSEWNRQPQNFDRPDRPDRPNMRDSAPDFGFRGCNPRFNPQMPKEIRALAVESAKLRIDLNEALNSNPIEKEKALEIYDKIMKLEQDIERWRFTQKLDRIEAFKKQQELNRNFSPTPPAPPAPEAPAPEAPNAQ